METVDLTGSPGLLPGPELFVTYLVFIFGFAHVETTTPSLTIFLLYFLSPMSSPRLFCEAFPKPSHNNNKASNVWKKVGEEY